MLAILLLGVLCILSLAVLYLSFLIWRQIQLYSHLPGTEPDGLMGFFLGNLNKVMQKSGSHFCLTFEREFQLHNAKTIKLRIIQKTMVVTRDPKIIKAVFIDEDCPRYDDLVDIFRYSGGVRFLKNGIGSVASKEEWKHQRAFFNPGFNKQCLKEFTKEFNEKGSRMVEYLRKNSETSKDSISLFKIFNYTAFDAIASIAFGIDIDSFSNPDTVFARYLETVFNNSMTYLADPLVKYKPWKWSFIDEQRKMVEYIREYGRKQIQSRIDNLKNGEGLRDDLLTVILKASCEENGEKMDMETMIDNFLTFFFAGQETVAVSLASVFLEIGRNPNVLEKLKDEIDTVIGKKAFIEYDDLAKLKYTEATFKETLRLHPPASFLMRKNEKDLNINGVFIPKNSAIVLNLYCAARDEGVFEEPLQFNPDRFLDTDVDKKSTYNFLPFSLGPRNCIGQNFARTEAKILIAKFIQNLNFELDPNQSFDYREKLTLQPKDGTKCFISIRN